MVDRYTVACELRGTVEPAGIHHPGSRGPTRVWHGSTAWFHMGLSPWNTGNLLKAGICMQARSTSLAMIVVGRHMIVVPKRPKPEPDSQPHKKRRRHPKVTPMANLII